MKQPTRPTERGAILIFVAITIVTLMAFGAFVIDYGVFWMSRSQAQNAADAGALAGAATLVFQDNTWPIPAGGAVETAAIATANQNLINNAAGIPKVSSTCPGYLVSPYNTNCIQVDVYRDGTFSSATLPTYFANLFGVASQGTRATATAQVSQGNAAGCMRPWYIVDNVPPYCVSGCASPPYPFAGYSDIGTSVVFHDTGGPSSYGQLDVGSGGNAIQDAIDHCYSGTTNFAVNQVVATKPGSTSGPEQHGIDDLLSWDPDSDGVHVEYQPAGCNLTMTCVTATVVGGCAQTGMCSCPGGCPYGGTQSPRLVQAALCTAGDPMYPDCNGTTGNSVIKITNILSFFITGYVGHGSDLDIQAILVSSAGQQAAGGSVGPGNSFITVLRLVR
jgi:hypothetical protein